MRDFMVEYKIGDKTGDAVVVSQPMYAEGLTRVVIMALPELWFKTVSLAQIKGKADPAYVSQRHAEVGGQTNVSSIFGLNDADEPKH